MEEGFVPEDTTSQELENKQAMLAAIVESSEDAIISKTLQGIITSWNVAAEMMFGYKEEEVIGKHISLLIPTDKLPEEDMIIDRIRRGLRVEHFETVRVTKSGSFIPISLTISPIRASDGKIIGASKIARDITAQLRAQREIQEHANIQELLLSSAKALSANLDLESILQKVTDITTRLTEAEFSVFRPAFDGEGILRSDDITNDPRFGEKLPHRGLPMGHISVVSYLAIPIKSPTGGAIGGLFFGHSKPGMFKEKHEKLVSGIAAQAGVAIDNAKLYEEIKILNSRKDEFIGIAGHELRTPITTIKGYLQLLEDQSQEGAAKLFTEKALRQVNKLNRLIGDLLDVTKIQSGQLQYNMISCFLLPLIRESLDTVRQMYTSHFLEAELPAEDIVITADGAKIEQVLINLLTNAIKYSPDARKIRLTVTREPHRVVVAIRDWGIGIPTEHLENIFHRYYRVESSSEHVIAGLGIGLYISKDIINRHKGSIWAESEVGSGSVFYFALPLPE
jgi:PAS domain S-box-containing protein